MCSTYTSPICFKPYLTAARGRYIIFGCRSDIENLFAAVVAIVKWIR